MLNDIDLAIEDILEDSPSIKDLAKSMEALVEPAARLRDLFADTDVYDEAAAMADAIGTLASNFTLIAAGTGNAESQKGRKVNLMESFAEQLADQPTDELKAGLDHAQTIRKEAERLSRVILNLKFSPEFLGPVMAGYHYILDTSRALADGIEMAIKVSGGA